MDLHEALDQMAHIRRQLAHSATFRGYRAFPTAVSSLAAVIAAAFQPWLIPDPNVEPVRFVRLWVAVALFTGAIQFLHVLSQRRSPRNESDQSSCGGRPALAANYEERLTWRALELLVPSVFAGGLLTAALTLYSPESIRLLPGLWAILLSQGVFASLPILPRQLAWAGYYYLVTGVACLVFARGEWALSPWSMAAPFGGGQGLTAVILYYALERDHASES